MSDGSVFLLRVDEPAHHVDRAELVATDAPRHELLHRRVAVEMPPSTAAQKRHRHRPLVVPDLEHRIVGPACDNLMARAIAREETFPVCPIASRVSR